MKKVLLALMLLPCLSMAQSIDEYDNAPEIAPEMSPDEFDTAPGEVPLPGPAQDFDNLELSGPSGGENTELVPVPAPLEGYQENPATDESNYQELPLPGPAAQQPQVQQYYQGQLQLKQNPYQQNEQDLQNLPPIQQGQMKSVLDKNQQQQAPLNQYQQPYQQQPRRPLQRIKPNPNRLPKATVSYTQMWIPRKSVPTFVLLRTLNSLPLEVQQQFKVTDGTAANPNKIFIDGTRVMQIDQVIHKHFPTEADFTAVFKQGFCGSQYCDSKLQEFYQDLYWAFMQP